MKNLYLIALLLMAYTPVYAQEDSPCSCPPIKMYIYDTKMKFALDSPSTAEEAGKYIEAQHSGDWLEGAYLKQRSDEFQVYKNIAPDANAGSTYEPPTNGGTGPSSVSFTSFVNVDMEGTPGAFTYNIQLIIVDAIRAETAVNITQVATDLGEVDSMIDALIGSLGSVPDKLRDYQKHIRDGSNNTKWVGLKWRAYPDKLALRINQSENVRIKAFDCVDEKPAPNQKIRVRLTNTDIGALNGGEVTTDANGEAVVVFKAKKNGETRVVAGFTFTDVNEQTGNATSCSDEKDIIVAGQLYKVELEATATGPAGIDYKYKGESFTTLKKLADGSFMLDRWTKASKWT